MSITEPPPLKTSSIEKKTVEIFYPYQSSLSPRLGMGSDSQLFPSYTFYYLLGVHYMLPNQNGRHWEVGVDAINNGTGRLTLGKKFVSNHNGASRPYFKVAAGVKLDPSEQFNTILKLDFYQLRVATGFEYFLAHPISARVDFEGFVTTKSSGIQVVMGYSWAW